MEDFVTFEQAKALKELGFDWKCNHYYFMDWGELISYNPWDIFDQLYVDFNNSSYWNNGESYTFSAPTLAQVQKWLYNQFSLWIEITYEVKKESFEYYIFNKTDNTKKSFFNPCVKIIYDTPTKALSEGIDKVIEILKGIDKALQFLKEESK